jgi:hypothetical protein
MCRKQRRSDAMVIKSYFSVEAKFTPRIRWKLKGLAAKAREICKKRMQDFIMKSKQDMNILVRRELKDKLQSIKSHSIGPTLDTLDDDEEGSSFGFDSQSDTSDPFGTVYCICIHIIFVYVCIHIQIHFYYYCYYYYYISSAI